MKKDKNEATLRLPTKASYIPRILFWSLFIYLSVYLLRRSVEEALLSALTGVLAFLVGMPFCVLVHEAGHLLFGLATGYRTVSFRIFSFVIKKKNGTWRICRESSPVGSAGQCLMAPPRKKNGSFPYRLINAGGVVLGFVVSAGMLAASLTVSSLYYSRLFLFVTGLYGAILNLINAIPTSGAHMVNDGTNGRACRKSPVAREAFWNQLEYTALHAAGVRTRDMPAELFFLPEPHALTSALTVTEGMMQLDREEDEGAFEDARQTAEYILQNARPLHPALRAALAAELLFCELVLSGEPDKIRRLYSETEKGLSLIRNHASAYRSLYAYHLLRSKDDRATEKALIRFECLAAGNPAATLPDRDMIAYAQKLYESRKKDESC